MIMKKTDTIEVAAAKAGLSRATGFRSLRPARRFPKRAPAPGIRGPGRKGSGRSVRQARALTRRGGKADRHAPNHGMRVFEPKGDYEDMFNDIVGERIQAAGVRLGAMLNGIFGNRRKD